MTGLVTMFALFIVGLSRENERGKEKETGKIDKTSTKVRPKLVKSSLQVKVATGEQGGEKEWVFFSKKVLGTRARRGSTWN